MRSSIRPRAGWFTPTAATIRRCCCAARKCPAGDRRSAGRPFPGLALRAGRDPLEPGDLLVLYTDGISEAENPAEEEWGEAALIATVRSCRGRPPGDHLPRDAGRRHLRRRRPPARRHDPGDRPRDLNSPRLPIGARVHSNDRLPGPFWTSYIIDYCMFHRPPVSLQEIAPNLEMCPGGWWASSTVSDVSYPEEGNALCFSVEESSFWFEHRNRCILEAVRRFPPAGAFFDVGGGNGCVAFALQQSGLQVVLVEPGLSGVRNAVKRGIRQVVRSTLEDAGVLPGTLPAVGLFDVIEHIEDAGEFLKAANRLMTSGGRIYVTVPAYQWLWSGEDKLAGHWRRYNLQAIVELLRNCGFALDFATYIFWFLPY